MASQWLLEHGDGAEGAVGPVDLSGWMCVLRGGRAGRVLLHALLEGAKASRRGVIPPRVVTLGGMMEQLLDAGEPIAQPMERALAWMQSLRSAPDATLGPLMPAKPSEHDWATWHRMAKLLDGVHAELAGANLRMKDVADAAASMEQALEAERWLALEDVLARYRAILAGAGLVDVHAARWAAIQRGHVPGAKGMTGLALIGVVEMNKAQRAAIRAAGVRVMAFVHADARDAEGFDELGCVRPAYWSEREIALSDEQVIVADTPGDQAQEALRAVARLDGSFAADEIVIGLGDETLRADMERAALWAGVPVHAAQGDSLALLPAARLLDATAAYLEDDRFAPLASLLRHADMARWIARTLPGHEQARQHWLGLLDRYYADHLQQRMTEKFLGDPKFKAPLKAVHQAVRSLLAPLMGEARPLSAWMPGIVELLRAVYGEPFENSAEDEREGRLRGWRAWHDVQSLLKALAAVTDVPSALDLSLPAPSAIRLLLREISGKVSAVEPRRGAIELLGWLELDPEPAPVVIIAGVNDGRIPASVSADPFLPDSLRRRLGLTSNASRYARDACLLDTLLRGSRRVTLITGRRSAAGEPLTPSRLLLACSDAELPRRVQRMCSDPPGGSAPLGAPSPGLATQFVVPALPAPLRIPTSMRVTDFRLYLQCPYRFALERMLRLEPITDRMDELDPMSFGSLAHDVLRDFGVDDQIRESTDEGTIARFLHDRLSMHVKARFGAKPLTAVQVQAAQLAQRLRDFAKRQAELRAEGWRIVAVEHEFEDGAALDVPGQASMPMRGKIDRIDRHERSGAWRIIDYKTSDGGDSPLEEHHGRKTLVDAGACEWFDLQLPLYRYLALRSGLGVEGAVELGYIVLPKRGGGAKWIEAPWTEEHHTSAVACAQEVVRRIREGRFERRDDVLSPFDPFARICQTTVFGVEDITEADAMIDSEEGK